jgi:ABC-type transport system involved in multi-copper enzyme maturation permease subunit
MLRLLSIEFHKLKYNRASKTLSIIYFGLLLSIALVTTIKFEFGDFKLHLADQGIFNFPYIWHFNTYMAAILKFFLLLVIVSMIADEYSYKTLKQNLIDGLSKKEFILSKFYTVIVFSLISTVFVFVISLILGLMYSDYNELSIIVTDLEYLSRFFHKTRRVFSLWDSFLVFW